MLQADLDSVRTRRGDFVSADLDDLRLAANAPEHVLAAFQQHAADRKALLFTPSVATAHAIAETFSGAGVAAEALDGTTPEDECRAILHRLSIGDTQVVSNCAVLTEGFDEPSVYCIIVARPTKSKGLYTQMIGRGTRLYPGKSDCLILDVVGVSARRRLMTAATLFGLEADDFIQRSIMEVDRERQEREELMPIPGTLISTPVELFARRPMRWIQTPRGVWILPIDSGHLRLMRDGLGTWQVQMRYKGAAPRNLYVGLPLDYAQGIAEDTVRELGAEILVDQGAPWRAKPASHKQLALLHMLRAPVWPNMTRGEASDEISRVDGDRG